MLMRKAGRRQSGSRWEAHRPDYDRFVPFSARSYVIVRFRRTVGSGTSDTPRARRHAGQPATVLAIAGATHPTIM